jgi:hypothetical protein
MTACIDLRIELGGIEQGCGFGLDFFAEGGGFEDSDAGAEAEDEEAGVFFAFEADVQDLPIVGEVGGGRGL